MTAYRDTYKYHIKRVNKILHTGITNDLRRREYEHQQNYGDGVHIKQVGYRTTREAALQWEAKQRQKDKPADPRRNTYKYHIKRDNKILHTGITNDLRRREYEHQQNYGDGVHIKQVGYRTTREAALQWEAKQRQKDKPADPRRNTYKYHIKRDNKILHTGITNDLRDCEREHQQNYGDDVHIKQVGYRTTREAALRWEFEQRQKGKPVGH